MAIGVLSALWQAGRRVPADVAVVSCDDISYAEFLTPPLTTVRVPLAETGRQAVELLLRGIAGEPVPEKTAGGSAAGGSAVGGSPPPGRAGSDSVMAIRCLRGRFRWQDLTSGS